MLYILLFTAAILFAIHLYIGTRRPVRYPPGPAWFPVVGNLFQLKRLTYSLGYQHLAFECLTKQFNSQIIGLKLGSSYVIVVHGYEAVHQVLTRSEFDGRPNSFFMRLRCFGKIGGIMADHGPLWQKRRHFVIRHLKDLGLGKQVMESMIQDELKALTDHLSSSNEGKTGGIRLSYYLAESVLNILWTLTSGSKFSKEDTMEQKFFTLMEKRARAFDFSGGLLNIMPWLRFILPGYVGYNLIVELNAALKNFLMNVINQHHSTHDALKVRDLIDKIIQKMNEEKNVEAPIFTEHELLMVCMDLFIAGSQTTSNTLDFAFLIAILHPEKQLKIQAEIDNAVGKYRAPMMSDRINMPYTEAFLQEIQRMYVVVPINGPRRVLKDTSICNYYIPKNTTVLYSTWSVHMDPEYWKDPNVFRPERFLSEDGKFLADERVIPYGLGKRRCLGEILARNALFLFFVGVLQKFVLKPVSDENIPSPVPCPGITLAPQPFYVILQSR